ncbi:MAG: Ig-like domain-containing protein [Clostridia bacterium]|nr:Ig-like domain-containing protein [Clostridia bacterium]
MKKIDKITAIVLAVLFAAVAGANLFQPNRPTESALEQRTLAKIPSFSLTALTDGSYFSGLSSFFSDTFLGRDKLVDAAKEMDTLMGIPYDMGGEEQFALLQTGNQTQTGPDASDEEALAEAFDKLMNRTETETTADPDVPETEPAETEADETEPPETEPAETEPAETEPADTEPEETKPAETEPDETKPAETEPQETKSSQTVNAVTLSRETVRLTIGSGSVVYATVDTSDGKGASVSWSISDKNIATIAKNPGGGIDVKGVAEGECTLYCRSGIRQKRNAKSSFPR